MSTTRTAARTMTKGASLACALVAAARSSHAEPCAPGAWVCPPPSATPPTTAPAEPSAPPAPSLHPAPPPRPPAPPREPPWARDAWAEARPAPPPPRPPAPPPSQLGLQARLEGVLIGGDARASNAGMGGFGVSVRPRPRPELAVDFAIDLLGGHDYTGDKRSELAFAVSPIVFVNPRDPVQAYFLAGLDLATARVDHQAGGRDRYGYLGVHVGFGAEARLSKRAALSLDLVGIVRGRLDTSAGAPAEYIDPSTGRVTNTSGGGLLRLGGTWYF